MKSFFISFILVFFLSNFSFAQGSKSSIEFGFGGLPVLYFDGQQDPGYAIRANAGYYLSDNLVVGLLGFNGKVSGINSLGASVYCRYYLGASKFRVFAEGQIGLGALSYETTPEYDGTMRTFGLGIGTNYAFSDRFSVEVILPYSNLQNISYPEETTTGNVFIPTIGLQFRIAK